jgi:AAA ATPase domain
MDPVRNPYGPGAGTPPPELSGRSRVLRDVLVGLQRKLAGRPHKSIILVGLRGVGKTVLLNRIDEEARRLGFRTALIEVGENKPLPQLLVPTLRAILYGLDRMEGLNEAVKRGFRVLRSFVGRVSMQMGDVDLGLGIDPEVGTADSGDLDTDLAQLFVSIGEAAAARKTAITLIVDELQYLKEQEFAALIMGIHRVTQANLPVHLVGAALPTIRGLAGRAKSYAERLFEYPTIGALTAAEACEAIQVPAQREGASFTPSALEAIQVNTQGYPYFLQEWAYQAWNVAADSPVTADDVRTATTIAIERLDESFFRVRFDRLTNSEKKYLRAMASLGAGPHRSSDIAVAYKAKVTSVGPTRATLINKGMIYSPAHGDAAFTVPLFDEFMCRVMPLLEDGS